MSGHVEDRFRKAAETGSAKTVGRNGANAQPANMSEASYRTGVRGEGKIARRAAMPYKITKVPDEALSRCSLNGRPREHRFPFRELDVLDSFEIRNKKDATYADTIASILSQYTEKVFVRARMSNERWVYWRAV